MSLISLLPLSSKSLERIIHTSTVFTLLLNIHSSIDCNLTSSPTISLKLLLLKSELMTSYVTKTTNHFQNFSDLSMNIFISHIFVTVDATNNSLHPETLLPQLPWSLLFISSCHLNWLVSWSSTLSSLLTQPVLLANFICTHILKFQLYANHLHIFVSSP